MTSQMECRVVRLEELPQEVDGDEVDMIDPLRQILEVTTTL